MKIIIRKRDTGKTTKLIKYVLDDPNSVLIVFCEVRKQEILKQYPDLRIEV